MSMKPYSLLGAILFIFMGAGGCASLAEAETASAKPAQMEQPNVLFIAVDDLRPDLGTYGHPVAQTPHMDALAKSGIQFDNAFVSQAVCGPSRAALMLGLRPSTTGITKLSHKVSKLAPDAVTMSQMFRNAGYHSIGIGKIYHKADDDMAGWTERPEDVIYKSRRAARKRGEPKLAAAVTDRAMMPDTINVQVALKRMRELGESGEPFFMAVGIHRPHLPFNAPQSDWDRYDPKKIPGPINPQGQKGAPDYALVAYEVWNYEDTPDGEPMPKAKADQLRHAYLASTSYADGLVGELMAELKATGLDDNTIVVLWGDHGWKIADHNKWAKHSTAEIDIHVPLIMRVPGMADSGTKTSALVETVDLYPTLADLTGIDAPSNLEGMSLRPLLGNPDAKWKEAAFSQFGRNGGKGVGRLTGHTVRTDRYRYTEWRTDKTDRLVDRELYDLEIDPNESTNVAGDRNYADAMKKLAGIAKAGPSEVKASVGR